MAGLARKLAASILVVLPVSAGLGVAPAHAVTVVDKPTGGCWSYVPDRSSTDPTDVAEVLGPLPLKSDISTDLEPWSGDPASVARLSLETEGDPMLSGNRPFTLRLDNGPKLSSLPASGTAYALFSMIGPEGTVLPPVQFSAPFSTLLTGGSVESLELAGRLPVTMAGDHVVRLDSLFFDVPGILGSPGTMTVCNSQLEGFPSVGDGVTPGTNPLTAPVATELSAGFVGAPARVVAIDDVVGQARTTGARAGDQIKVRVEGLPADAPFTLELCSSGEAPTCVGADKPEALISEATGAGSGVITVPADFPAGAAQVHVDRAGVAPLSIGDLSILGAVTFEANEVPGEGRLDIGLNGASWDPATRVTIEALTATGSRTSDPVLEISPDLDGGFVGIFTAVDPGSASLRVTQERTEVSGTHEVTHTLVNAVPGVPPIDDEPPAEKDPPVAQDPPAEEPKAPGTTAPGVPAPPSTSAPVAAPPVSIPQPVDLPFDTVDAPVVDPAAEGVLKVTEARLDGETSFGELFGGSPRREVVFQVENEGEGVVVSPSVRFGVGRDATVDPVIVASEIGDLQPGARAAVSVDVALPMASFGTYQVVGQVGDSETNRFNLEWQTYPWGLIALNVMGIVLLVWGLRRRHLTRNRPAPLVAQDDEAGASVIDLTALDQWWTHGRVARAVSLEPDDNDSVVDLDAADRWWSRHDNKVS